MTYDTPGETDTKRRWCSDCELSVAPVEDDAAADARPICPACGSGVA
ncbi:hypothetical protein [Halorubrum vacuolatum]|uniref:Small CPxCG-related zinc finger protein n=1 Tax=Halorubrum vacuolatum TaxID=63740 RepID=A0A238XBM9_HALVU|nr:hypothetical protein [Halorubrum vacuolatum]SNR55943.1 hypothetical protein SAMN06264855_11550 [Halorubrum vacuolatum]